MASDIVETRWKLNHERMQHLKDQVDSHKMPVSHKVTGKGKAQTLVLQKTQEDASKQREKDLKVLQDLEALLQAEPQAKKQKTVAADEE